MTLGAKPEQRPIEQPASSVEVFAETPEQVINYTPAVATENTPTSSNPQPVGNSSTPTVATTSIVKVEEVVGNETAPSVQDDLGDTGRTDSTLKVIKGLREGFVLPE